MFLRHTTANENNVGTWERGHMSTDSIFRESGNCQDPKSASFEAKNRQGAIPRALRHFKN